MISGQFKLLDGKEFNFKLFMMVFSLSNGSKISYLLSFGKHSVSNFTRNSQTKRNMYLQIKISHVTGMLNKYICPALVQQVFFLYIKTRLQWLITEYGNDRMTVAKITVANGKDIV